MRHQHLEDLPDLVTVKEATDFLRVSRNTLYDAIRAGVIPSVRIGRRVLIPKNGLRRLLDVPAQALPTKEACSKPNLDFLKVSE